MAGRHAEALARLEPLRPVLVAVHRPEPVHVTALDRMTAQIRLECEVTGQPEGVSRPVNRRAGR